MLRWVVWAIVVGWAVVVCDGRLWPSQAILAYPGAKTIAFLLKTLVAFQACRFFVETRRNGSLELLLCSPLLNADLITAQWRALRRIFLWPLVVFLLLCVATVMSPLAVTPFSRAVPSGVGGLMEQGFLGVLFLAISLFADILAVGWFGMWLALTMKKAGAGAGTDDPVCPGPPSRPLPAGSRRGHAFCFLGHHAIAAGFSLARARSCSAGPPGSSRPATVLAGEQLERRTALTPPTLPEPSWKRVGGRCV